MENLRGVVGMSTNYVLTGRMDFTRRPTASTLLFSLAKQVARAEKRGEVVDFAIVNFSPCAEDGDYVGRVFMQSGWGDE